MPVAPVRTYIGVGSNLDQPARQVAEALIELARLPQSRLCAQSNLYQSRPLGPQDQPDFINAAALLETELAPLPLLRELQALEARHGRNRASERHWGPRTLDLDILLYGDLRMHTQELTLPHPRLCERSFVLYPLAELAPELRVSDRETVRALRDRCALPKIQLYEERARE